MNNVDDDETPNKKEYEAARIAFEAAKWRLIAAEQKYKPFG